MRDVVWIFIAIAPMGFLAGDWFDFTDWEWWALLGSTVWYGAIRKRSRI